MGSILARPRGAPAHRTAAERAHTRKAVQVNAKLHSNAYAASRAARDAEAEEVASGFADADSRSDDVNMSALGPLPRERPASVTSARPASIAHDPRDSREPSVEREQDKDRKSARPSADRTHIKRLRRAPASDEEDDDDAVAGASGNGAGRNGVREAPSAPVCCESRRGAVLVCRTCGSTWHRHCARQAGAQDDPEAFACPFCTSAASPAAASVQSAPGPAASLSVAASPKAHRARLDDESWSGSPASEGEGLPILPHVPLLICF